MFLVETTGTNKKAEMKWIFRNVPSLEWPKKKTGEYVISPDFHSDDDKEVKWCVWIYPNGSEEEYKEHISVFLLLNHSPKNRPNISTKFTFTLLDKEGKEIYKHTITEHTFSFENPGSGWGCTKTIKLADVLKNDMFSLTCNLEYTDPKNPSTKTSILRCPLIPPLSNEELTSSLNQNLEQLFNNRSETADVRFVVAGKEIKSHKAIVSARSPVFTAMLKSGMKESVENRIEINDIALDIFEALLRFIYTGRVELTQVDAKDLLAAANKYLLPLLKLQCQQFLSQIITLENYVELLLLADLHSAVHLEKSVLNFIRLNRDVIMQSEGWKKLKQSRPDLSFVFNVVETLL